MTRSSHHQSRDSLLGKGKTCAVAGLLSVLLSACANDPSEDKTSATQPSSSEAVTRVDRDLSEDLRWVAYRDAVADVNLAVEREDYHLIALTNGRQTIPGLNQSAQQVQRACGLRYASKHSDTTSPGATASSYTNLIQQYASQYNQLMWQACQRRQN